MQPVISRGRAGPRVTPSRTTGSTTGRLPLRRYFLPPGAIACTVFVGQAVHLFSVCREDLLRSKLFALWDRGSDLPDCLALAPTAKELATLLPWVQHQDANPDWPAHVKETLADLGKRLGHGS
jgi:hypothetical protein